MRLKHLMFAAGLHAIAELRVDRLLRSLVRGCGIILMFHRVRPDPRASFAPNGVLEITPEFLDGVLVQLRREGFDIIPISQVGARLEAPRHGHPFAVLTFDDGYRDNVEHAWPVLRRHGAPWTLFVTTEFADGKGRLWWLELEQAIAQLDCIAFREGGRRMLPARTSREKQAAFTVIYQRLRAGPEERLRTVITDLAARAGIDGTRLVRGLCLGWKEICKLAHEADVTIGSHTVSHPILTKHDARTAVHEVGDSKAVLERRLGRPVSYFAYPFGDRSAAGAREFRFVREAGYAAAVTSRPGHLFPYHADHLHALPRVSINGLFQSQAALRALFSGAPFLVWNGHRVAPIET